jgi:predicted RNA-binding protein with PIN domain
MNVIGARAGGWWRDPDAAVRAFVDELDAFASRTGDDVTVVFDRRPAKMRAGVHGRVLVGFAPTKGRNAADMEIVRRVERDPDPGSLTVVTSDRELAESVRKRGASVEGAGRFAKHLAG